MYNVEFYFEFDGSILSLSPFFYVIYLLIYLNTFQGMLQVSKEETKEISHATKPLA